MSDTDRYLGHSAPKHFERSRAFGQDDGPNETGEVKSTVAQNLVSEIGTFNRENFTRLAKDTDFTQLIGFARANDTSGAIARALIAKLDSLELAQLGEATSSILTLQSF